MGTRTTLFEVTLAVLTLALGIVLHDSTAAIVLFSITGLAIGALIIHAIVTADWFWRRIAQRVEPHLSSETVPVPLPAPAQAAAIASAAGPTDGQLAGAIDDLLDELATIHGRLTDAIDAEYYGYKFFLPSAEYTKNRNVISAWSSEARAVLSEVYVQADALNNKMPGPTADGIEMAYVDSPDPVRLREIVSRAQATLRDLRP